MPKVCYWCGKPLTDNSGDREHVPPLGFFPKGHRERLMTVPACTAHNSALSSLDEEFQLYIKSVAGSDISISDFKDRTVRSLKRNEAKGFISRLRANTFFTNINGEATPIVRVEGSSFVKFFEKIIRGLYFYHNDQPASGLVHGVSPQFPTNEYDVANLCRNVMTELSSSEMASGDCYNPRVFRYEYLNLKEDNAFFVVMYFYEKVQVVGWVVPHTLFDNTM